METFKWKDDCPSFINGLLEPHQCSTPPLPFSHLVQRQLENLKSGFSAFVPWFMLRCRHTFQIWLFLAAFEHVFISRPIPPSFHTTPSAWFGKKKRTLGENHQQHHYDVLFYKEPHWQPVFWVTSLKSTQRREKLGAFIKTQPFCLTWFISPHTISPDNKALSQSQIAH